MDSHTITVNVNEDAQPLTRRPMRQLKINRGMLKFILLSFITFGIYAIVVYSHLSDEINLVASPRDGKKTMHFCLLFFLIGPLTFGIAYLVWFHRICGRIGDELTARGISYSFGSGSYWLWNILGCLIIIGPFVFLHKLFKAMNLMNADYNARGSMTVYM